MISCDHLLKPIWKSLRQKELAELYKVRKRWLLIKSNVFCNNSAWLESWDDEVVATVNRRIGAATGLEMDTAEPLQVSTPVLCERYEPPENCSLR